MIDPGSAVRWHQFGWLAFRPILFSVLASMLVLDANWMVACLREAHRAEPPVFRTPATVVGRWRKIGLLLLMTFWYAPMMLRRGVWRSLGSTTAALLLTALSAFVAVQVVAERRGWRPASMLATVALLVLPVAPFALMGSDARLRYVVIAGLFLAFVTLLFLAATVHRLVFGYRPRSR